MSTTKRSAEQLLRGYPSKLSDIGGIRTPESKIRVRIFFLALVTLMGIIIGHSALSQKSRLVGRTPEMMPHRRVARNLSDTTDGEIKEASNGRKNKVSMETATGALLNDIEDDLEDDENEEFYKKSPLEIQSSPGVEDNDYLELADIELEIEPDKSTKQAKSRPGKRGNKRQRAKISNKTDGVAAQQSEWLLADEEDCALVLQRPHKECISYADVDQAIERAKSRLDFDGGTGDLSEASINAVGELAELTTSILADKFKLTWDEITFELERIDMRQTSMWKHCHKAFKSSPTCTELSRYRTHSGHCNNLLAGGSHLGASKTPFRRNLPPDYADRVGGPRTGAVSELPPVRLVALNLHPDFEVPSRDHSALFMAWGQLLNHDLAMASNARDSTGHSGSCCGKSAPHRTCMPIDIAADDPLYSRHGIGCHEFKRSLAAVKQGCSLGPRSQINTITSYVDASFVYGSSASSASMLRGSRGRLQVWNYFERRKLKPLMPPQIEDPDEECVGRSGGRYCFLSGDLRTNQQIQLVALHTVHMRQHNRLASGLARINPHWTDNRLYHEARHIHIALVQHFLISEYLPALLGPGLMAKYNLEESPAGSYWNHYQPSRDASISNGFAAAAFRQGHSTVPSQVHRYSNQHKLKRTYQLRHTYRQPWPLFEPGAMDEFLLGALNSPSQTLDPFVSADVSGHLLQMPDERVGLDLIAINIQRGRDQGVPGYNAHRDWCDLRRASKFSDLRAHMRSLSAEIMSNLYASVDDIDLFTGGIGEFPLDGAQVGPTFACIIGHQFESLRAGDRFWFENSHGLQAFTLAQLDSIKQVSLARVICANSDDISTIQEQALHLPHPVLNPRKPCDELSDLDLSLWAEKSDESDDRWAS